MNGEAVPAPVDEYATEPTKVDRAPELRAFAWPADAEDGDLPDGSNFYDKRVRS